MTKHLLGLVAALSLLAVLAPVGASAQGNSGAAQLCQQGGYAALSDREGGPPSFADTGQCVSAAAHGAVYPVPTISIVREGTSDIYGDQAGTDLRYCFFWVTYHNFLVPESPFAYEDQFFTVTYYHDGVVESVSGYLLENGNPAGDIVPFGVTQVIVATDKQTGEVLATGAPQVCEAPA